MIGEEACVHRLDLARRLLQVRGVGGRRTEHKGRKKYNSRSLIQEASTERQCMNNGRKEGLGRERKWRGCGVRRRKKNGVKKNVLAPEFWLYVQQCEIYPLRVMLLDKKSEPKL